MAPCLGGTRGVAALVAALLVTLAGVPGRAGAAETPRPGGVYRAPLWLSPSSLDPARSPSIYGVEVIQQIFDGLVEYDADLHVRPALAEGWHVSLDGLTYTFRLRQDARFHNGRAVTASDVVYSLTRVLLPQTRSEVAPLFAVIDGAPDVREGRTAVVRGLRAVGPLEVEVRLAEPYAPFLALLATRGGKIVPREAVEGEPSFGMRPVGTGPFRFVRWEPGREIVLERNPLYHAGPPHLDRLIYRLHPDRTDADVFEEFRKGGLEHAAVPASVARASLSGAGIPVRRRPILGVRFYGFQLALPEWKDRRVRVGLTAALDPSRLLPPAVGQSVPTRKILPPGLPGYLPEPAPAPADPELAARLLAEAGHAEGRGLPAVTVWSAVRGASVDTETREMSRAWGTLGLRVSPNFATDWPEYTRLLAERRLPLFRYAWYADIPDPDNVLGVLFHSRSPYNHTGYANPEVDRLLEQGRREMDPVARADLYVEIERRILADAPIIPISFQRFEVAYQPYVRGVEVSALGAPYIPMRKVWLDVGRPALTPPSGRR